MKNSIVALLLALGAASSLDCRCMCRDSDSHDDARSCGTSIAPVAVNPYLNLGCPGVYLGGAGSLPAYTRVPSSLGLQAGLASLVGGRSFCLDGRCSLETAASLARGLISKSCRGLLVGPNLYGRVYGPSAGPVLCPRGYGGGLPLPSYGLGSCSGLPLVCPISPCRRFPYPGPYRYDFGLSPPGPVSYGFVPSIPACKTTVQPAVTTCCGC